MILIERTLNNKGVRYWFLAENRRNSFSPHKVQILLSNKQILDATCTCIHGTIQIDSKFRGNKRCTHIKDAIKLLEDKKIL